VQAKKAQGDFLMSDVLGLSGDVTATRKRPSSSNDMRSGQLTSEDGQLIILGSSAPLSAAIADLIHKEGLSHTLSESPLLARVIKLARTVPASYNPPTRKDVGGRYLDVSSTRYEAKNAVIITANLKFGLSLMSDGATVHHVPLVNILTGVPNQLPVLNEIADCTEHMSEGGTKDGLFLAGLMLPHALKHGKRNFYLFFFIRSPFTSIKIIFI
jgi:hypothetical protein